MTQKSTFLKDINFPSDLKKISEKDLPKVANEVRSKMIDAVCHESILASRISCAILACRNIL